MTQPRVNLGISNPIDYHVVNAHSGEIRWRFFMLVFSKTLDILFYAALELVRSPRKTICCSNYQMPAWLLMC